MSATLRSALLFGACSAVLTTLNVVQPGWFARLVPALDSLPRLSAEWGRGQLHGADLDDRLVVVQRHVEEKRSIAREVIAGRMGLLEAAARFQRRDQSYPEFAWEMFRTMNPGKTDAEKHCWEVIRYARAELAREPGRAVAVVARLTAELGRCLDHGMTLPE